MKPARVIQLAWYDRGNGGLGRRSEIYSEVFEGTARLGPDEALFVALSPLPLGDPRQYSRQLARRLRAVLSTADLTAISGEDEAGAWVYRIPPTHLTLTKAIGPLKEEEIRSRQLEDYCRETVGGAFTVGDDAAMSSLQPKQHSPEEIRAVTDGARADLIQSLDGRLKAAVIRIRELEIENRALKERIDAAVKELGGRP